MENQTIAIDPYEYEIIELIDGDDDADNGISYARLSFSNPSSSQGRGSPWMRNCPYDYRTHRCVLCKHPASLNDTQTCV